MNRTIIINGDVASLNGNGVTMKKQSSYDQRTSAAPASSASSSQATEPEDVPFEEFSKEEPSVDSTHQSHPSQPDMLTPVDRIINGLKAVIESGIIQNDYEYAAVVKYVQELKVIDTFYVSDLLRAFIDFGFFTPEKCPSRANIAKITIGGKYPNWKVTGKNLSVTNQLFKVAKTFKKGYESSL